MSGAARGIGEGIGDATLILENGNKYRVLDSRKDVIVETFDELLEKLQAIHRVMMETGGGSASEGSPSEEKPLAASSDDVL